MPADDHALSLRSPVYDDRVNQVELTQTFFELSERLFANLARVVLRRAQLTNRHIHYLQIILFHNTDIATVNIRTRLCIANGKGSEPTSQLKKAQKLVCRIQEPLD